MVWCVSRPGIHGKLQSLVRWRRPTVGQTTNVAEDGVTTSGYGAEYAWQIRAIGYSPVGDEVIPSNASLWHVMSNACNLRESSFNSVQVSAP